MNHIEAKTKNLRLSAPEGIEAKLQHPVGFFLDLPNLSNDVLTEDMFHDSCFMQYKSISNDRSLKTGLNAN